MVGLTWLLMPDARLPTRDLLVNDAACCVGRDGLGWLRERKEVDFYSSSAGGGGGDMDGGDMWWWKDR